MNIVLQSPFTTGASLSIDTSSHDENLTTPVRVRFLNSSGQTSHCSSYTTLENVLDRVWRQACLSMPQTEVSLSPCNCAMMSGGVLLWMVARIWFGRQCCSGEYTSQILPWWYTSANIIDLRPSSIQWSGLPCMLPHIKSIVRVIDDASALWTISSLSGEWIPHTISPSPLMIHSFIHIHSSARQITLTSCLHIWLLWSFVLDSSHHAAPEPPFVLLWST